MVRSFGYKNFIKSKKTAKLHTVLSKKFNDTLVIEEETSETGLGFVDKFAFIWNLHKRLEQVRGDILTKKSSSAYPHGLGNEFHNRSVFIQNSVFE